MGEIISRAEARASGLKRYFDGAACIHGHASERLVCDGSCCECRRLKALKNHHSNKDEANRKRRERRAENIDSERRTGRLYREANIERERERCRKWIAENKPRRASYVRDNSALFVSYAQARKAQKLRATPVWAGELDEFVMAEAAELCLARMESTGISWQVDHMIPMQAKLACGLHCASNMQVIPASMNSAKRNKMELTERDEWLCFL